MEDEELEDNEVILNGNCFATSLHASAPLVPDDLPSSGRRVRGPPAALAPD